MVISMRKMAVLFCMIGMMCIVKREYIVGAEKRCELVAEDAVAVTSQDIQVDIPPLQLYAQGAVLMDAKSGRVLYSKNGKEQLPMASTTKIMTLIVTLERANLEDIVKVSSYAASMPNVQLHIREGEQYRLRDLLYSLMLESHNDSAVAIAEHVAGSVEEFSVLMNQKAKEIGCENTWFITPNGLDATAEYSNGVGDKEVKEHLTTAEDLARIMAYCIMESPNREQFLEITRTSSYSFTDVEGKRSFGCTNHNAFLGMMEGALSGKTGFTNKAGYCYVGALKQGERVYTVALLACGWPNHKTYKWSDTRQLMEYGLEYYTLHNLEETKIPSEVYEPIVVLDAQSEKIGEKVRVSIELKEEEEGCVEQVMMNPNEDITIIFEKAEKLTAPIKKGQSVGELHYMIGEEKWKTMEVVAAAEILKIDLRWSLKTLVKYWMI